jgi:hypothetical protein
MRCRSIAAEALCSVCEILEQYVGTYDSPRCRGPIIVSLEGNRLMIDTDGAGKIPLIAQAESRFSMEGTLVDFLKIREVVPADC